MASNRKLGRTTDIRNAMLKNLTTDVIVYGKVETTDARAKEVKSIVDSLVALAVKEKDNYEEVEVKVVKAKLPLPLIDLTIKPKVSTCALVATSLLLSSPLINTSFKFTSVSILYFIYLVN